MSSEEEEDTGDNSAFMSRNQDVLALRPVTTVGSGGGGGGGGLGFGSTMRPSDVGMLASRISRGESAGSRYRRPGSLRGSVVQIKFADHLGSVWAVDGYCIDWEVRSFEGPFCCRLGCDHGGKGCVPWNDLLCIAPVEVLMSVVDRLMWALFLGRGPVDARCGR